MNHLIRQALESDAKGIEQVTLAAFGKEEGPEIAELIDELMADPTAEPRWSLVATAADQIIGHILFTKVRVEAPPQEISSSILAPLSVDPHYQKQGLGGQLISDGLKRLKAAGVGLVFVLGHPGYYPRAGFSPAGERGMQAPYPIPAKDADAWMVRELQPDILGAIQGNVVCANALNDPKYWRE